MVLIPVRGLDSSRLCTAVIWAIFSDVEVVHIIRFRTFDSVVSGRFGVKLNPRVDRWVLERNYVWWWPVATDGPLPHRMVHQYGGRSSNDNSTENSED